MAEKAKALRCNACGRANDSDARFCIGCGEGDLEPIQASPEVAEPAPELGPLAAFFHDADSMHLPAAEIGERGQRRSRELVLVSMVAATLGTAGVLFHAGHPLWLVGTVVVSLLALSFVMLVVLRRLHRTQLDQHVAKLEDRRARGLPVACWSRRFVALNGVLALAFSALLATVLIDGTGPALGGDATPARMERFTTPSGRCSLELPGRPERYPEPSGSTQWRARSGTTTFILFESDMTRNPGSVAFEDDAALLEAMAAGEIANFEREMASFELIDGTPTTDTPLPGYDLRYFFRSTASGPRLRGVKRTLVRSDRTVCAALALLPADADQGPAGHLVRTLRGGVAGE